MSDTKLCPFRKTSIPEYIHPGLAGVYDKDALASIESFGHCLQDKCAMWRVMDYVNFKTSTVEKTEIDHIEYCGLAGKIQ
jgi:hypothetical protein